MFARVRDGDSPSAKGRDGPGRVWCQGSSAMRKVGALIQSNRHAVIADSILVKQVGNLDVKTLQQPRFRNFAGTPAAEELIFPLDQMKDLDRLCLRVNQPVLLHAVL